VTDPIYQKDGIGIYCADFFAICEDLEKVDHVITDPPYDRTTHTGATTKTGRLKEFGIEFDPIDEPGGLAKALINKARFWVLMFCPVESLGKIQGENYQNYVRGGIWDRITNTPQLSGDRPAQAVEGIAILHAKRKNMEWNGGGKAAIWRWMVERNKKQHPTQKPLSLMRELIEQFTNPGETILDPFCGSGSTLRAAMDCGRKAIGVDVNIDYCNVAISRLSQLVLF